MTARLPRAWFVICVAFVVSCGSAATSASAAPKTSPAPQTSAPTPTPSPSPTAAANGVRYVAVGASVDPAAYGQALSAIVTGLVTSTDATIFVGNVPDLLSVPVYASVDKTRLLAGITAYNDAIARIAATAPTRVVLVDLFTGSAAL